MSMALNLSRARSGESADGVSDLKSHLGVLEFITVRALWHGCLRLILTLYA